MKYAWIEAQAGWQPIARLCKVQVSRVVGFCNGVSANQAIGIKPIDLWMQK